MWTFLFVHYFCTFFHYAAMNNIGRSLWQSWRTCCADKNYYSSCSDTLQLVRMHRWHEERDKNHVTGILKWNLYSLCRTQFKPYGKTFGFKHTTHIPIYTIGHTHIRRRTIEDASHSVNNRVLCTTVRQTSGKQSSLMRFDYAKYCFYLIITCGE